MLHSCSHGKPELNLITSSNSQNLRLSSASEGSLIASRIVILVDERVVTNVGRRVAGEFDGVVFGDARGGADVLGARLDNAVNDVGVEEVVG